MKQKNIKYGKIELKDEFLNTKNHKVRITAYLDGDILLELKKRAIKQQSKYQTLMNHILRDALIERN